MSLSVLRPNGRQSDIMATTLPDFNQATADHLPAAVIDTGVKKGHQVNAH